MAIHSAPMDLLKARTVSYFAPFLTGNQVTYLTRSDIVVTCPQELQDETESCSVYQGFMTMLSHATDDLTMSIASIRAGIKRAMDDYSLLDPTVLPTITKIVYLGDNEKEAVAWGGGGNGRGENFVEEDNDKEWASTLTASIFAAALLA